MSRHSVHRPSPRCQLSRVSGWLALSAALIGACDEPRAPIQPCPTPTVVSDPFPHSICLEECVDALDCPRGTLCSRRDEGVRGHCALPSDTLQSSRAGLLDGFNVEEMSAELRVGDEHALAWTRPDAAKLVHCALFACPPAFRVPYDDAESQWLVPTDGDGVVIANYDRCVLASANSTQGSGSFNLRERDNQYESGLTAAEIQGCGGYGCAPITELLAGCWAYDDTQVVAATRLFPIDLRRSIYNYHRAFAVDAPCGGADAGRVCTLADVLTDSPYGVCPPADPDSADPAPAACARPCLSDCDCLADGMTAETCRAELPRIPIGYCRLDGTCTSLPSVGGGV